MAKLRDGKYWLNRAATALASIAEHMARVRYGTVPDLDARVSDAQAALVEAACEFKPQPGKDGFGYFLNYVLARVSGDLRQGAQSAKDEAQAEAVFTDLDPEDLGLDHLYECGSAPDVAQENTWVTKWGHVRTTTEVIDALVSNEKWAEWTAHLLGVEEVGSTEHRVALLRALDDLAERESSIPTWTSEPPAPEPILNHSLNSTYIRRIVGGEVIEELSLDGDEFAEEVARASASQAPWVPEQLEVAWEPEWARGYKWLSHVEENDDDDLYDDEEPLGLDLDELLGEMEELAQPQRVLRPVEAAHLDEAVPADRIRHAIRLIADEFKLWAECEQEPPEISRVLHLSEYSTAMEIKMNSWLWRLAELMDEEDESDSARRNAVRELAEFLSSVGVVAEAYWEWEVELNNQSRIAWRLRKFYDLPSTSSWQPEEREAASSLSARIASWLDTVSEQYRFWPSQTAAIKALALHCASPYEARQIARQAYAAQSA